MNQGGKRKGAVCAYLETWHLDIEEFLELRKNTGDDRRRTHDMNTANWVPDLFMKRVLEGGRWTLFSPNLVPDLHETYGKEFEQRYTRYEQRAAEGAGLTRNDLPQSVHSGPWSTQGGTDEASAHAPYDAPFEESVSKGTLRGQIIDAVSIRERPAEAEDRAVPGHWEGDLLSGSNNTHIATLVERHSRFTILVKVKGKDTESVVSALGKQVRKLPAELRRSVTWDRGMELAQHKKFTVATDVQVYFCYPQSPWQRGTNENTNGLLRQYFPKGTSLAGYSQGDLNRIALQLNQRPRKTLGFMTPADKLNASIGVAFTG